MTNWVFFVYEANYFSKLLTRVEREDFTKKLI